MKFEIKNRWTLAVQFTAEIPDETPGHLRLGLAIKAAYLRGAYLSDTDLRGAYLSDTDLRGTYLRGADLSGAYLSDTDLSGDLRGADLRGADLSGADLSDTDLSGADLSGADLSDTDLSGAVLSDTDLSGAVLSDADLDASVATPAQAVANLDRVREIILDDPGARLRMDEWHHTEEWRKRTCAEEATCGTTHCLAGWLQVCSTDDKIRKLKPNVAGVLLAPVASKMFYRTSDEVLSWLEKREYAGG